MALQLIVFASRRQPGYGSLHCVVSQWTYWSASYAEPTLLSVNVPTSWLKIQIDTGQEFYKGHRLEGTKTKNYLFFFKITDDAVLSQISRTESLLPKQSGVFSHYYMVRLLKLQLNAVPLHLPRCLQYHSTEALLCIYACQYFFIITCRLNF